MAVTQADRLGLDLSYMDPNLEARLRNIETELAKRSLSSISTTAVKLADRIGIPPAIIGLKLQQNVNTVTATWTESEVANLLEYDINTAKDIGFSSGVESHTTKDRIFTLQSGDINTTYYIRVRVRTQDGVFGDWSPTLNTATGLVTTPLLTDASVTTIKIKEEGTAKIKAGSQGATIELNTSYAEMATVTITKDDGDSDLIVTWGGHIVDTANDQGNIDIRLQRDNSTVFESLNEFLPINGTLSTWYGVLETGLAAADYVYDLDANSDASTGHDFDSGIIVVHEVIR